jgi:hypothetical protein
MNEGQMPGLVGISQEFIVQESRNNQINTLSVTPVSTNTI